MNHKYEDLRSLYQAAAREEQPTRADTRAVRAAIVSAGAAAVTLHTTTAAGKLIALIPGGAKVLTISQVVVYTGLGVALGGGIAAVGVAVNPKKPAVATSTTLAMPARKSSNPQIANPAATPGLTQDTQGPTESEPRVEAKPVPTGPANVDRPLATSSSAPAVEHPIQSERPGTPMPSTLGPTAIAPAASPPALAATPPPSLAEESRGLAAVQTALGAHDPNRALALLDAQDHEYRAGNLGQERAAARVLALCAAGRRAEALAARDRFMSNYPGSPLIHRVNAACKK